MHPCVQPGQSHSRASGASCSTGRLGEKPLVQSEPAWRNQGDDPYTFIVVGEQDAPMREQVDFVITLNAPATMSGVVLMSRGELLSTFAPQQFDFSTPVTARYLKLIALSGFGADKTTSLAELAVIVDQPVKKSKPTRAAKP